MGNKTTEQLIKEALRTLESCDRPDTWAVVGVLAAIAQELKRQNDREEETWEFREQMKLLKRITNHEE